MRLQLTLVLLILSISSFAQTCDCTVYPFKPESCYKTCTGRLLKGSSPVELALILGLSESTVNAVAKIDTSKIKSLDDYKQSLKPTEYAEVFKSLGDLNRTQADYFLNFSPLDRGKMLIMLNESLGPPKKGKGDQ